MRFDLVSIFPDMIAFALGAGVVGRARDRGLLDVRVHDLRDYADPPHRRVDDEPFGGGPGMLFCCPPLARASRALSVGDARTAVVLPSPAGEVLTQPLLRELAEYEQLVVLCDRYEGSDARVRTVVTHEVSLGDFVITGGELAALVIVDAVARLVPGVVGRAESVRDESFSSVLLDHDSYTRPARYRGHAVPAVLASGDHGKIRAWRLRNAVRRTLERRPELLADLPLAAEESEFIARERGLAAGT